MEKYLFIAPSPIHGIGLYTIINIKSGELLFITSYLREVTQGHVTMKIAEMTKLGSAFNHSSNANTGMLEYKGCVYQYATRDIKADEELTADYRNNLPYFKRDIAGYN
jgi:SET domain-containing protein